jgi:hypothetical protein
MNEPLDFKIEYDKEIDRIVRIAVYHDSDFYTRDLDEEIQ